MTCRFLQRGGLWILGPAVLMPAVVSLVLWLYLFFTGQTTWGVGMLLWNALVVGQADNVLRPLLIGGKAGMPLPLLIVGILWFPRGLDEIHPRQGRTSTVAVSASGKTRFTASRRPRSMILWGSMRGR